LNPSALEGLEDHLGRLLQDGLVVAFSGGVDSTFLLWAAERARRKQGGRLLALTTESASMPAADREDALEFVRELGVEHLLRRSGEMRLEAYTRNDENRCYHCKAELFEIAESIVDQRGWRWIAYGYNASDVGDVRPGHRAAQERGVRSPLADAGLTKDEIRTLMRTHGLRLAEKPASPCLSSRIMTGLQITPERLEDVEALEAILRAGGIRVCRVRVCREGATAFLRLEVAPAEMPRVLALRDELLREAQARGYRWVTLDLEGYRTGGGRT
jgi:uncharacterized protein